MKKAVLVLLCAALVSCKSGKEAPKVPAGPLTLDKAHSSLSAVAIKNGKVPVTVNFKDLEGSLTLQPFKAELGISLDTLQTGDEKRDANVKRYFFETLRKEAFKKAAFELKELEGGLEGLKEGEERVAQGKGELSLHGVSLAMSGPLTVKSLPGGAYSASFKEAWVVSIKGVKLMSQLKNLNKHCPKPHQVGEKVALTGELVFGGKQ
ncbi:MAG: YceI family protein [candidate division FCPU426 bacterium]